MAPHSSTLAWKIPWMEELGRLQSTGSLKVRHDWATSFHFSLSRIGEGNGNPLRCFCLENPRDGGAWWAAVYGVAQSRTRLKQQQQQQATYIWPITVPPSFGPRIGSREFMWLRQNQSESFCGISCLSWRSNLASGVWELKEWDIRTTVCYF